MPLDNYEGPYSKRFDQVHAHIQPEFLAEDFQPLPLIPTSKQFVKFFAMYATDCSYIGISLSLLPKTVVLTVRNILDDNVN